MRFEEWVARLTTAGHRICPASTRVPLELCGLRPDGTGMHFRCRGTRATLSLYAPGRARWQVRVFDPSWTPEETLAIWERRPYTRWEEAPPHSRLVFDDAERPDVHVVYDGARERGWTGHEAGLLRVDEGAALFEHLLGAAVVLPAAA